ncbi:MAG: hypothetical protein ACT4PM_12875 [Gemmatimonadales bacterium]
MSRGLGWGIGIAAVVGSACGPPGHSSLGSDSDLVDQREARFSEALGEYETGPLEPLAGRKPVARWYLPRRLAEVSGVVITADGRVLVHNDQIARITEIDIRHGEIIKSFDLGRPVVRGDFEGITRIGDTLLLMTSNGLIYEFREGHDGERVNYRAHDTGLGSECEFEGIASEPASGSVVLACKVVHRNVPADALVFYRWRPGAAAADRTPVVVPLGRVRGSEQWKRLHPSDLAIDPENGRWIIVAGREQALIELRPDGSGGSAEPLPGRHEQPEGVAISAGRMLIIGDEAARRPASLTLYRLR